MTPKKRRSPPKKKQDQKVKLLAESLPKHPPQIPAPPPSVYPTPKRVGTLYAENGLSMPLYGVDILRLLRGEGSIGAVGREGFEMVVHLR